MTGSTTKPHENAARTAVSRATAVRTLAVAVAVSLLLSSAVAGVGAAATDPDPTTDAGSALVVDLAADGDATVTVLLTFDLEDDADRAAFEELKTNDTERERLETRTATRLESVAAGASEDADREMTIDGTVVSFETDDAADRGVVAVSVAWGNLAAAEDGALRVDEPFASGFAPDRPFVLRPPEGYDLERNTHEPSTAEDGRIVWSPGTDLDGFEVRLSTADGDDSSTAGGSDVDGDEGPEDGDGGADDLSGFGVLVGLFSLIGGGWLCLKRRPSP